MTHGIAVRSLDNAGGGDQLAGGQDFFFVENEPVVVIHDPLVPHGVGLHGAPKMAEGSEWFLLNGQPACREGHLANCGHPTTGRGWFFIS